MTKPVALPIAFGSRRFGKVQGAILDSDGKSYPQPSGSAVWQFGQTMRLAFPGTDPAIEEYGFKTDALLSGGRQQLYGKDIDGWVFCDTLNGLRWLIQPDLAGAATTFTEPLSIGFQIVKFGVFDGEAPLPKTSVTKTLASWGQDSPAISNAAYTTCANQSITDADLHLVSTKTDGSVALLMVSLETGLEGSGYLYSGMPLLRQWPIGFIGVTCTAVEFGEPTLALSVIRNRADTIGIRSDYSTTGGLVSRIICPLYSGVAWEGTEQFTQGVSGAILALSYGTDSETGQTDQLLALTISCTITGDTVCDPAFEQEPGLWKQHSESSLKLTWTLECNHRTTGWEYELAEDFNGTVNCGTLVYWSYDRTESFNGSTYEYSDGASEYTLFPSMPHSQADDGAYVFALHGACRSVGDLWLDGYWLEDNDWYSLGMIRYAYDVVGLYALGDVDIRGPAISPGCVIAATAVGTGDYGAYNARTGQAIAGAETPVGYV